MVETWNEAMSERRWRLVVGISARWALAFPNLAARILILGNGNQGAPFGTLKYGVDESSKTEMNEWNIFGNGIVWSSRDRS
jgi:hypothetical protein